MPDTNAQLQAYLDRPLPDLMDELALYDDATRGPADTWRKISGPIHRRICDEWHWCEVRQDSRFENDYDLAVAIFTVLSTRVLQIPLDVDLVLVSAILIKRGVDGFCGCP